jgi:DNA replicative helicase MCM subunit Mcm2 (Cdc46/Mcm family)
VLLLRDSRQPAWDRVVSSQVLANHAQHLQRGGGEEGQEGEPGGGDSRAAPDQGQAAAQASGWTIDVLQKYMVWVKRAFQPVLTPEAEALLVAYYQSLRQAQERSAARTTIRMLESLIRVAQVGAAAAAAAVG